MSSSPQPTHRQIITRLEERFDLAENERVSFREAVIDQHKLMFQILENIEVNQDDFRKDFSEFKTDISSRLIRIEGRVGKYDSWLQRAKDSWAILTLAAIVVWYFIHDNVEALLGVVKK